MTNELANLTPGDRVHTRPAHLSEQWDSTTTLETVVRVTPTRVVLSSGDAYMISTGIRYGDARETNPRTMDPARTGAGPLPADHEQDGLSKVGDNMHPLPRPVDALRAVHRDVDGADWVTVDGVTVGCVSRSTLVIDQRGMVEEDEELPSGQWSALNFADHIHPEASPMAHDMPYPSRLDAVRAVILADDVNRADWTTDEGDDVENYWHTVDGNGGPLNGHTRPGPAAYAAAAARAAGMVPDTA